jgi:uncharacterized membrane protein
MSAKDDFLSKDQEQQIVRAIQEAENNTSGEIRVHVSSKKGDVMELAIKTFQKLGMHKTELRNGVLFFVDIAQREFVVLGDEGIDNATPEDFWEEVKELVLGEFRNGNFAEGLILGIQKAGEKLKAHFPYQSDDVNELSDEISKS